MQILNPSQAPVVCGGAKSDLVNDSPTNAHPVPIWRPVFVMDP